MCTLELRATHTELRRQLLSQVLMLLHMLRMRVLWCECSYVVLVHKCVQFHVGWKLFHMGESECLGSSMYVNSNNMRL